MTPSTRKRPVVVAVSGDQPELLSYAAGMAQMLDAPLRVVHAQSFHINTADLYEGRDAGTILHDAAQRVLDEAQVHLAAQTGLRAEYTLRTEPPVFAIATESKDAVLVMLGADDVAAFEGFAGADIARRAALHSDCPVLVVPQSLPTPAMTEIVVAIDVDNVVEDALSFAFDMASRTGAGVRVVTVLPRDVADEQRVRHEGDLRGFESRWRKAFPHVASRAELVSGDPGDELAREAMHAQLIVVGHPNQPHRAPFFSKHVAGSLLRATPCVVAVVPAGRES